MMKDSHIYVILRMEFKNNENVREVTCQCLSISRHVKTFFFAFFMKHHQSVYESNQYIIII